MFFAHFLFPSISRHTRLPLAKIAQTDFPSVAAVGAAIPVSKSVSGGTGGSPGIPEAGAVHSIFPVFLFMQ